ncbi:hypothetical protein Ornrh_2281 [Ornithobacterium rhinotracheale DSM 15997]|uniref:Uncharacterized protein n=1 Tax=Ornithobacterium rhinotracheale (strain ATCC 51463 / DSM 15997 / CCUG 23171 / CIP 104009 / LMG 9086) TaxID=867902 RepID=I4A378_ORNRL|nr:hypothetical protein Ornrh_2281 [Ornithobacterium rhinotracheale DSM 15997]
MQCEIVINKGRSQNPTVIYRYFTAIETIFFILLNNDTAVKTAILVLK